MLCTTVDSERTQLAGDPASTRVDLGAAFTRLRNQIQAVATTAYDGGIVLSARMITKRYIQSTIVDSGTLPYNASSSSVILGTTIGSSVVFANDTNSALANIAVNGNALGTQEVPNLCNRRLLIISNSTRVTGVLAEQATSEDIQPSGRPRTLQASYTCKKCEKRYKPTLEIFAVVGAAIFAILTPAFAAARIIAELWVRTYLFCTSSAGSSRLREAETTHCADHNVGSPPTRRGCQIPSPLYRISTTNQ